MPDSESGSSIPAPPIGWIRIHGKPVDNATIDRVLRSFAGDPDAYGLPEDLANEVQARLRDERPRAVAVWLRDELRARQDPFVYWLDMLLAD